MRLNLLNQKLPINNLDVDVDGGKFSKGKICINEDPYSIVNHTVQLFVKSNLYPGVEDSLTILLDYKNHYKLNLQEFSGNSGSGGRSGFSGSTHEHGGDGENGQHGNHAIMEKIWMFLLNPITILKLVIW